MSELTLTYPHGFKVVHERKAEPSVIDLAVERQKLVQDFHDRHQLGERLASLADGEGCFSIARTGKVCSFIVKLRADDEPFLAKFRDGLELGRLVRGRPSNPDGADRKPYVAWITNRKRECLELTLIFDRYELWSKKARDYGIWREAVIYWNVPRELEGLIDWAPMQALATELRETRRYR